MIIALPVTAIALFVLALSPFGVDLSAKDREAIVALVREKRPQEKLLIRPFSYWHVRVEARKKGASYSRGGEVFYLYDGFFGWRIYRHDFWIE